MQKSVLIDTDPGVDDALALLLALSCQELQVKAITTVSGNVPVEKATTNLLRILKLLPGPYPVLAQGAEQPLEREPFFSSHVHGIDGLGGKGGGQDQAASAPAALSENTAAEEILRQTSDSSQPLTLISLGPLTNIALALEQDPDLKNRVQELILMGGAYTGPGNITPAAEFNIYVDPEAADLVFRSGMPITAVGLDVTRQVRLSRETLQDWGQAQDNPIRRSIQAWTTHGLDFMQDLTGEASMPLHDPLAALYCGTKTVFLARIGKDHYGQALAKHLLQAGLPAEGLIRDQKQPAGLAFILVDNQGRNQIVVVPGSNHNLSPADVQSCAQWFTAGDILLVQLEIPLQTVAEGLKLAKSRGLTTILDPAPFQPLPAEVLGHADILTPNQQEAAALAGTDPDDLQATEKALQALLSPDQTLILTLGGDGALMLGKSGRKHVPACQIQVRDTVAAGDAFNGALAAALARGRSLAQAMHLASAAGALCSTRSGAQAALPGQTEVERLAGMSFAHDRV